MGRRFLLILGLGLLLWLSALCSLTPARAQADGGGPPALTGASATDPPPPRPSELAGDEAASSERASRPSRAGTDPTGVPAPVNLDGLTHVSSAPVGRGQAAGEGALPQSVEDPAVKRTDAPAAASGDPDPGAGLPVDRLPRGRQSVAVTVEVQSPAHMNLNQTATVRLVVRNTGTSDALQVRIRDELPEGLKYVSSQPEARVEGTALTWSLDALPGGSEHVIAVKVKPIKPGPIDHGASVWFQTGSTAQARVYQPRLQVELTPSSEKVLRGQSVEFKVVVKNVGDGPARKVTVKARLSKELRYGSGERGSGEMVTEPIPVLEKGQSEEIDPLVAEAVLAGAGSCTVVATSPDVAGPDKVEEARSVAPVAVVEPGLAIALSGPGRRCTDTVARYEIAVKNPGTAPARKVRVVAHVPSGARLTSVPRDARYDPSTRRLIWAIDSLEPSADQSRTLSFDVKVGDVGRYAIHAEALAEGIPKEAAKTLETEVFGMPDVDLVVTEPQRVVDVGGTTVFVIQLSNKGTKEATNIRLSAVVSKNLKVTGGLDVPAGFKFFDTQQDGRFALADEASKGGIKRLGPGKSLRVGLEVQAIGDKPEIATCRVFVIHDGLSEEFEDMARVQVLPPAGKTADGAGH